MLIIFLASWIKCTMLCHNYLNMSRPWWMLSITGISCLKYSTQRSAHCSGMGCNSYMYIYTLQFGYCDHYSAVHVQWMETNLTNKLNEPQNTLTQQLTVHYFSFFLFAAELNKPQYIHECNKKRIECILYKCTVVSPIHLHLCVRMSCTLHVLFNEMQIVGQVFCNFTCCRTVKWLSNNFLDSL